jgi:hypothetical protein
MPLKLKHIGDDYIVETPDFNLRFSKSLMGISSFAYLKGGCWHDAVNPDGSGILYVPRLSVPSVDGGVLEPHHDGNISIEFVGQAAIKLLVSGYLSNSTQGSGLTDFPFTSHYMIYENGAVYIRTTILNSGELYSEVTEEHILDPKDDNDITLERDTAPNLWYAGFYSDNTGDSASDLSHDGILIQYGDDFTVYVTYTDGNRNAAGLSKTAETWVAQSVHDSNFLLHLSCDGSYGDITDAGSFEAIGDELASDYRNSDSLTGGPDEGD